MKKEITLEQILSELKALRAELRAPIKRLLDIREAAVYVGLAERTIRRRVAPKSDNPFPVKPVRWDRKVLFRREDLDKYIDGL